MLQLLLVGLRFFAFAFCFASASGLELLLSAREGASISSPIEGQLPTTRSSTSKAETSTSGRRAARAAGTEPPPTPTQRTFFFLFFCFSFFSSSPSSSGSGSRARERATSVFVYSKARQVGSRATCPEGGEEEEQQGDSPVFFLLTRLTLCLVSPKRSTRHSNSSPELEGWAVTATSPLR